MFSKDHFIRNPIGGWAEVPGKWQPVAGPRGDPWRPKSRKNRNFQIVPKVHQMVQNVVKRRQNMFLSDFESSGAPNGVLLRRSAGSSAIHVAGPRGDPWRPKSRKNRKFQIVPKVHQMAQNVVRCCQNVFWGDSESSLAFKGVLLEAPPATPGPNSYHRRWVYLYHMMVSCFCLQ